MHAQRCPMAKLRVAAQQNSEALSRGITHRGTKSGSAISILPFMSRGIKDGRKKQQQQQQQNKGFLCQRSHSAKGQERPSFFQKLHGDVVPLMPPRPQMYGDDDGAWRGRPRDQPLIHDENCAVHGRRRRPAPQARQSFDAERLKNWRRDSLAFAAPAAGLGAGGEDGAGRRSASSGHHGLRGLPPRLDDAAAAGPGASLDDRRSQFRRAWSLFSIGCDDLEKRRKKKTTTTTTTATATATTKPPPQRILRPPTRHVYRRGVSGLPIECRHLGVAF